MIRHPFKSISVYFDENYNLHGVPSTEIKKWNALVDIEEIVSLYFPYSDNELERFLQTVFDLCYSITPKELPKQSALQKYLGAKSYSASVIGLGLVSLTWLSGRGYQITPTWQNAKLKNAFHNLDDKAINIDTDYAKSELAKAFRSAISYSPIGPINREPE